jgi:prepilin-type N-terminal cleavage/methylation domain-containing protein
MNKQQKQSGFTIIEVVLVLAIAGLIFLMVFIALPALQRNQRDGQRKNDLGRVKTALTNYMTSNRGNIPTSAIALKSFQDKYLIPATEYVDPQGDPYVLQYNQTPSDSGPAIGTIIYANARVCGTDGVFDNGSSRDYAFQIKLEGQTVPFCLDSK